MTYPAPTTHRRRLPYHSEQDMLELEARRGIHAGMLPSNASRAEEMDGVTGGLATPEQKMRGWSAQQPFVHVDCAVMHHCILCGSVIDPDYLKDHANKCRVRRQLELLHGPEN